MEILKKIYFTLNKIKFFHILFDNFHVFEIFNAIKFYRIEKHKNYYWIDVFYKNIKGFQNPSEKKFILLKWASWDLSLYYLLLKPILFYLKNKNISVSIICDRKYKDIAKLVVKNFSCLSFVYLKDTIYLENEKVENIKNFLNLWQDIDVIDLRKLCYSCVHEFIKTKWNGHYDSVLKMNKKIKNDFSINIFDEEENEYHFDNINYDKISYLLSNFSNWKNKLIIWNMENQSLKGTEKDTIPFNQYLYEFKRISKEKNIKIIINSVYNNEDYYEDENLIVTKLNFQEIIYLCEHNYINTFISERNWLNDMFKIFYPEINQIIYYPDSYIICAKELYHILFHKELKGMDIKDFWHIPWNNIIEDIRWNYFDTIEKYMNYFGLFDKN